MTEFKAIGTADGPGTTCDQSQIGHECLIAIIIYERLLLSKFELLTTHI